MSSLSFRAMIVVAALSFSPYAFADTLTWTGTAGDHNWFTGTNWSGSAVPTSADTLSNNSETINIDGTTGAVASEILLSSTGSGMSNVNGFYKVWGDADIEILNGGSLSTTKTTLGGNIGYGGVGYGSITVDGSFFSSDTLIVGQYGVGGLQILNGATVHTVNASIGEGYTDQSVITVDGAGSTWTNTGNVSIGNNGNGRLDLRNSGTAILSGALVLGTTTYSTGFLIIGAGSEGPPAAPGNVVTSLVNLSSRTSGIVFNHTSSNYVFAPAVSGQGIIGSLAGTTIMTGDLSGFTGDYFSMGGTLLFAPSGTQTLSSVFTGNSSGSVSFGSGKTILTADSSAYTGLVNVTGTGVLAVNGSLGGTVDVASGGRLQGSGTVATVDVGSSGTVAPGNSIGTLNVSGNITFASGSVFEVEADTTSSDKIVVTGVAAITGGTVNLIPYQGAVLTAGTTYTILTAAGGVVGTFDAVTSSSAFLNAALSYDPNDVFVTVVRNDVSYASVAANANQAGVADAVTALGAGNALYDAIQPLSATQAQAAYQALDGELHANIKGSILDQQSAYERILSGRMAQAEDGLTTGAAPSVTKGKKGFEPAVWLQAYGDWGSRDGDGNAQSFGAQTKGMMTGVDWLLGDAWRMGMAFGYGHGDYQQDRSSAQTGTDDAYSVSVYGGKKMGDLALRMGGTYAFHQIDTKRNVSFPSYAAFLKAGYNAHSANAFAEVAYDAVKLADTKIQPFASAALNLVAVDRFTETGGTAALTGKGDLDGIGTTTLGVRLRQTLPVVDVKGAKAALTGLAAWKHAVGDVSPKNTYSLAGANGFKTDGAPLAQNAAVVGAGMDYVVEEKTTIGVGYQGQISSDTINQSVRGNVNYRF